MTGGAFGIGRKSALRHSVALAVIVGAAPAAWAQSDETAQLDMAALGGKLVEAPARMEFSAPAVPKLDLAESQLAGQRVEMTLLPPRRNAFGLALGMSGFQPLKSSGATLAAAGQPSVDVGVHYRHTLDSDRQVDVTAWRRVTQQPDAYTLVQMQQPTYGARVEVNLSAKGSPKKGLVADRGFIGLQLENGGRISIRKKNGGPMVYYRAKF